MPHAESNALPSLQRTKVWDGSCDFTRTGEVEGHVILSQIRATFPKWSPKSSQARFRPECNESLGFVICDLSTLFHVNVKTIYNL